jgi:ribosome-interacting GTPase 1
VPTKRSATVHQEFADSCTGARITGPPAKFEAQRAGRNHVLADGDQLRDSQLTAKVVAT